LVKCGQLKNRIERAKDVAVMQTSTLYKLVFLLLLILK